MPGFTFDDAVSFEENCATFAHELNRLHSQAGPCLSNSLISLAEEQQSKTDLLNALFTSLEAQAQPTTASSVGAQPAALPPPVPQTWFIEALEIEGFRGINNEGSPLKLKFKSECVSSISAPNGVGKSSIFDALSFAIRGYIPKLDRLMAAEKPQEYYLNRFHPGDTGTIKLKLKPEGAGSTVAITVTRNSRGARTVTGPSGVDCDAILHSLNREFVLVDGTTFQSFIDDKALDRGRAFSGLIGLASYSILRQQLQALANTRSFNTHFDGNAHAARLAANERTIASRISSISSAYRNLVKEELAAGTTADESQEKCRAALEGIPTISIHCADVAFMEINIDACLSAVRDAEGGPDRERLATVIQERNKWAEAIKALPDTLKVPRLGALAAERETALRGTSGALLLKHYQLSTEIMSSEGWSPTMCPTCGKDDGTSVMDIVRDRISQYDAVDVATAALAKEWGASGWAELSNLEKLAVEKDETSLLRQLGHAGQAGTITAAQVEQLSAHVTRFRSRAESRLHALDTEQEEIERRLPPSLVVVTTSVETARQLQKDWGALTGLEREVREEKSRAAKLQKLKAFLDSASTSFASADSALSVQRLASIEPKFQELFRFVMYSQVVPALKKNGENLSISLSEFFGLRNLSAQALLSESYRNGFAISVYLAAASLYGGSARFIVMDDVTSSFDAGHQHHLVEVIRSRFARPLQPSGPQVIFLSHDTMLEKLFNRHSGSAHWSHQRLEGTARTAVLLQSGAVNKVRDATYELLDAGRVDDAAPRVRQYIEYTLHTVIDRCRIPVPLDLAFGDDKKTPGEYLAAIEAAVRLHKMGGTLILDSTQEASLQLHSAMIVGNFLSHWASGQAQAFSSASLRGVMQAVDEFPDCFKYEPSPGQAKRFYASLSRR